MSINFCKANVSSKVLNTLITDNYDCFSDTNILSYKMSHLTSRLTDNFFVS